MFYTIYSSPIKNLGIKKNKKKKEERRRKEHETKIIDLTFEDDNKIVVTEFGNKIIGEVDIKPKKQQFEEVKHYNNHNQNSKEETDDTTSDETIPFDNPFEEEEASFISPENITEEIKIKPNSNDKDKTITFNNSKKKKKFKPNVYNETKNIIIEEHKEEK